MSIVLNIPRLYFLIFEVTYPRLTPQVEPEGVQGEKEDSPEPALNGGSIFLNLFPWHAGHRSLVITSSSFTMTASNLF
jgi:hypothetical protein